MVRQKEHSEVCVTKSAPLNYSQFFFAYGEQEKKSQAAFMS